MSQTDMVVANDTRTAVRADINAHLLALVSNNSGATEPATTFAHMWWPDITNDMLKQRNAANSAWIDVAKLSNWALPSVQNQLATAFATGGTSTAFTLTPLPALAALATGQEFDVTFHTAPGATPTLAVSGLTAKNLKYRDSTGAKQPITSTQVPSGWRSPVVYDGTDYIVREIAGGSPASSTAQGIVELATDAETLTGTDTARAITPANLKSVLGLTRLIPSTVVSGAAQLDVVMTAFTGYKNKLFVFESAIPVTDAVDLYLLLSTNGGVSYDAGASDYKYSTTRQSEDGTTGQGASAAAAQIILNANSIGNAAGLGISGQILFFDTTNTAMRPRVQTDVVYFNPTIGWARGTGFGQRSAAQDTDAFRIKFSSGNHSMTYALYGFN